MWVKHRWKWRNMSVTKTLESTHVKVVGFLIAQASAAETITLRLKYITRAKMKLWNPQCFGVYMARTFYWAPPVSATNWAYDRDGLPTVRQNGKNEVLSSAQVIGRRGVARNSFRDYWLRGIIMAISFAQALRSSSAGSVTVPPTMPHSTKKSGTYCRKEYVPLSRLLQRVVGPNSVAGHNYRKQLSSWNGHSTFALLGGTHTSCRPKTCNPAFPLLVEWSFLWVQNLNATLSLSFFEFKRSYWTIVFDGPITDVRQSVTILSHSTQAQESGKIRAICTVYIKFSVCSPQENHLIWVPFFSCKLAWNSAPEA